MPSTMSSRTATPSLGKPCRRFFRGRTLPALALASPSPQLLGGDPQILFWVRNRTKVFRVCHCFKLNNSFFLNTSPAFFLPSLHLEPLPPHFFFLVSLTILAAKFGLKALLQVLSCALLHRLFPHTHPNASSTHLPYFCPCLVSVRCFDVNNRVGDGLERAEVAGMTKGSPPKLPHFVLQNF